MRPRSDSRWLPWLVPSERVVDRLGVPAAGVEEVVVEPRPQWRSDVGFLGEAEVTRRLAESGDLNLFRAFPDSETAEIAVLHLESRRVIALQVKTVDVNRERPRATVNVYASSFRASPTTYFVVVAWLGDEARFHEECLLIPSVKIPELASDDGSGHLSFDFHPGSTDATRADVYKRQLAEFRDEIERLLT